MKRFEFRLYISRLGFLLDACPFTALPQYADQLIFGRQARSDVYDRTRLEKGGSTVERANGDERRDRAAPNLCGRVYVTAKAAEAASGYPKRRAR
ncbi:MAG: hypothetical protein A2Y61_03120 [Chloroflexi bacterium RBG_13_60_13]|nr:MAG: hypothetical protein A2Y61_03120 [Chloroflexi bacterium RBG_13_60_13]